MPRDTSLEYRPKNSAGWGIEQAIDIRAPINTNSTDQDIYLIDKSGPAIANNGLLRDGGVTELYEASTAFATGTYSFACSNGKILSYSQSTDTYYVADSATSSSYVGIGGRSNISFFNRYQLPANYDDAVMSSNGNSILAIRLAGSPNTNVILDEISVATRQITNTVSLNFGGTLTPGLNKMSIVRANTLSFASVQSTSGIIFASFSGFKYMTYYRNGSVTTLGTTPWNDTSNSITAYYNAGTLVFNAIYNNVGTIWYSTSPYNASTKIQFAGVVTVDGVYLGDSYPNQLSNGGTTLSLGAATINNRIPVFKVNVDNAGAVTTATGYGTYFTGDGVTITAANFTMLDGIVTPYGCTGIMSDGSGGAGTKFGQFHMARYRLNNPNTTQPKEFPAMNIRQGMLDVRSYAKKIAILAYNTSSLLSGSMVNDFGGGSAEFDITQGNVFSGANVGGLFFPLSNYSGQDSTIYKQTGGGFVLVTTTTVPVFCEIAPGVVSVNSVLAQASILDTNAYKTYANYAALVPNFFTNYTSVSASLAYLKIFNKYSSSIDQGQMLCDTNYFEQINAAFANVILPAGWSVWDGSTGVYVGDVVYESANLFFNNPLHAGVYVFNANVPPAGDASFTGGGIQMLNATAIQTPNYFGYYLFPQTGNSNLLSFKTANIFLLHGTFYAFDGVNIYSIFLTNGSTGTVVGAPVSIVNAIGLTYLCVSPTHAYFSSPFDNSIYIFDGSRTLSKLVEMNRKNTITQAFFNVQDNALYVITTNSIITLREEAFAATENSVNVGPLQMTENTLPAYTSIQSTADGLVFTNGNTVTLRTYYPGSGNLIPLVYKSAFYSPTDGQTMQVSRIVGEIYCASNLDGTFALTWQYQLPDGTYGTDTTTITSATRNSAGYFRFTWTLPHSNVLAGSIGVTHSTTEQKVVLMEILVYYKPDAEVSPLGAVTA
jgi:hypothetical protein